MNIVKKIVLAACIALFSASLCFAQQQQPQVQIPITAATIDFGAVMTKSQEGAAALKKLADTFDPRRKQLGEDIAALDKLAKEIGTATRGPKFNEFQTKREKAQKDDLQLRQDMATMQNALLNPLREKVLATITAFAKEKGLHTIQDRTTLIYADPALDITGEIIKRLDGAK